MRPIAGCLAPLALVAGLLVLSTVPAPACAPVTMKGAAVAIADESALIIYDEETKTEHFIRRGTFETKVPYFGFLVPTPSVPELAEAPDAIFPLMEDWTKPEVITKTIKQRRDWLLPGAKSTREMAIGSAPNAVAVLGTAKVAGYDATIIKATEAKALREWLNKHNYDAPPSLDTWLDHYIKKEWVFTAFQMTKPEAEKTAGNLSAQAVRMSFKTDKPFYPYMEPASQREPGAFKPARMLRVFYVGTKRAEGKLEEEKTPWPGKAVWSNTINDEQRDNLVDQIKGKTLPTPKTMWLTVFEDRAAPRPGTSDLFFSPSADQSTLARPPIVHYNYVEDTSLVGDPWKMTAVGGMAIVTLAALAVLLWRTAVRKA